MASERTLNVLVLGVGGNVSQGILKALALSGLARRTIGACVSPSSLGLYAVDRALISPWADDPAFPDWVISVCRQESVHVVLSGVEAVVDVLAAQAEAIRTMSGAICITAAPEHLRLGSDKLLTCQWLESNGLNFPRYAASDDAEAVARLVAEAGYPLIAKPRRGKRSLGLLEVRNDRDLASVTVQAGYILQEFLGDEASEYTAGAVCDKAGTVRGTIVFRRQILAGTTHRAEAGLFPDVRAEAQRIAATLRAHGPCNVQLRVSAGRPVCFEMNVRFSGTTPVRARLGFNEVEATLRHFVRGEPMPELPLVTTGLMLRYVNEMYVDPSAHDELARSGSLDAPADRAFVESFGPRR